MIDSIVIQNTKVYNEQWKCYLFRWGNCILGIAINSHGYLRLYRKQLK